MTVFWMLARPSQSCTMGVHWFRTKEEFLMKFTTPLGLAKLALALTVVEMGSISASAGTISISNLTEGLPSITTDLQGITIALAFEEARIAINLAGGSIPTGTRSVILSEPLGLGPPVSDFITLTAAAP